MKENILIEYTELTSLPNIGKEMKRQLNAIGINTPEDLVATGSRKAWLRIRAIDSSACYHRLCGLEGAIQGIRWHYLDEKLKKKLKSFYEVNR